MKLTPFHFARMPYWWYSPAAFYIKYNQMLSRIQSSPDSAAQHIILEELLETPNPQPVQINQAIAKGILCCELYENTSTQLILSDSITHLQDTIISTQEIQITSSQANLREVSRKSIKLKAHLRGWRVASLLQATAIAAAVTIQKLTH